MLKTVHAWLIFICFSAQADFSATVLTIIDGDTVDIRTAYQTKLRVRLIDIDAPERGQPYAAQSRHFLATLIAGQTVVIRPAGRDIYQRLLATIYFNQININSAMVANGYAWAYRYHSHPPNQAMLKLEAYAKQHHLGLWQQLNPVAPWDFKHPKK